MPAVQDSTEMVISLHRIIFSHTKALENNIAQIGSEGGRTSQVRRATRRRCMTVWVPKGRSTRTGAAKMVDTVTTRSQKNECNERNWDLK